MDGLMMDYPLTMQHVFGRAGRLFPKKEVVTQLENGTHRYTYADFSKRTRKLANALLRVGVKPGERIATFGWNTYRHLEIYFAVPCLGAVLHTLNVRLFSEQLIFVVNDAEDQMIFVDADLIGVLEPLVEKLPTVRQYVIMCDGPLPATKLPNTISYEDWIAGESDEITWPELNENTACAMCYTSGTTGNPKGVVYSHRSCYLHCIAATAADAMGLSERDTVLPFVPMFHANAWGLPQAAVLCGAKQVLPGRFLDPLRIAKLMSAEKVTIAAGVPTIWLGLLNVLDHQQIDLSSLHAIMCGGSAVPRALIEGLDRHNLTIIQAWGMTETSPVASFCRLKSADLLLPKEEQVRIRATQGLPVPGVDLRVIDLATNREVPWDSETMGEIQARGPWVARMYYHDQDSGAKFADGWLRTGDVAVVRPDGYIQIVDRTKDVIKSGGEWISTVDLENMIMGHPKVMEAAVIGVPHEKWAERPVAYVVPKPNFKDQITPEEILEYLKPQTAKWGLPDAIFFIDSVPKTSVGKFDKKVLRKYAEKVVLS